MTSTKYLLLLPFVFSGKAFCAEILEFYPNCIQEDSVTVTKNKHHFKPLATDVDIRDLDEMSNLLNELTQEAGAQGFEAVILTRAISLKKERKIREAGTKYKTSVTAKLANLCSDDRSNSEMPLVVKINDRKIYNNNLASGLMFEINLEVDLNNYRAPKPVSMDVTANQAFGIQLGTAEATLLQTLGDPDYKFVLTQGIRNLYGYGRGLWFQVERGQVNQIQYGGELLSADLKNMLPPDSPFDSRGWTMNGTRADNQTIESLDTVLESWELQQDNSWQIVDGNNRLTLKVEAFHPDDINTPEYRVKGFTLTYKDKKQRRHQEGPFSWSTDGSLKWFELHRLTENNAIPAPDFNYERNYLRDAQGQIWYLLNGHILMGVDEGQVSHLKLHPNLLVNRQQQDISAYLQALGLPVSKAEFSEVYPDYLDYYDRYEAFSKGLDIAIQFDSDSPTASVESATLSF